MNRKTLLGIAVAGVFFMFGNQVPRAQASTTENYTLKVVENYHRVIVTSSSGLYYLVTTGSGCYFSNPPDYNKTVSIVTTNGAPVVGGTFTDAVASESCTVSASSVLTFVPYTLSVAGANQQSATLVSQDAIPLHYGVTFTFGCTQLASALNTTVNVRQSGQLNGTGDTLYLFTQDQNCSITTAAVILPTVQFSAASGSVSESAGTVALTVQLNRAYPSAVTVAYATSVGTATVVKDFTAVNGTLTITAGATTGTISVPIVNDTTVEANETFTVSLSSPSNATLASPTSEVLTIVSDDAPVVSNIVPKGGTFTILVSGVKKKIRPFASSFQGLLWVKKVVFSNGARYIALNSDGYRYGSIKFYNAAGKIVQVLKPFGQYATHGLNADIITQPSLGKVYMVIGLKQAGYTAQVYEVTANGLVAITNVAATSKTNRGNILVGFRKIYGSDYGVVTMVKRQPKTLKVWKYDMTRNAWLRDSAKATLAKLKVSNNKITIK